MIKSYDLSISKSDLWDIYYRCDRREEYYNKNVARTTNVFIDDLRDIEYIENQIIKRFNTCTISIRRNK